MSKPDFEKMADGLYRSLVYDHCQLTGYADKHKGVMRQVIENAFNAGLEHAAEIAEGCLGEYNQRERWYENPTPIAISTAIRAERGKS